MSWTEPEASFMDKGRFRCPVGPTLGRKIPADSGMIRGKVRQIVRPTREKCGKMPGFGLFGGGLISVRSVVDLRLPCG